MIFSEVKVFQPNSFEDHRGELYTVFNQDEHQLVFNHDKVAVSRQHVLRGIHGDAKATKLITCLSGVIYFVVVDNRPESPT
jgi:dTDP-4-dehydrorhamnose 3,5-epimerase